MKQEILKKIVKRREHYESDNEVLNRCIVQQDRLRNLVEQYGESGACAATGYTLLTLRHHLRCSKPRNISEQRINMAEKILAEFNL